MKEMKKGNSFTLSANLYNMTLMYCDTYCSADTEDTFLSAEKPSFCQTNSPIRKGKVLSEEK